MARTPSLGDRIAQARREFAAREHRDVTPPEAAAMLGVSVPTYWRWERDERKPGRPALMAIAQVFGCDLSALTGEPPVAEDAAISVTALSAKKNARKKGNG